MPIRIFMFVLAVGSGFFASDIYHWVTTQTETVSLDSYCLLTTNECKQHGNSIVVNKNTSQPLVATQITSTWSNMDVDALTLTLQGYEMDMGTVKFQLNKTPLGSFQGDIILPVCTTDAMTWYGTLSDGTTSMDISIRMER